MTHVDEMYEPGLPVLFFTEKNDSRRLELHLELATHELRRRRPQRTPRNCVTGHGMLYIGGSCRFAQRSDTAYDPPSHTRTHTAGTLSVMHTRIKFLVDVWPFSFKKQFFVIRV
jgi:hypothetical protein